MKRNLIRIILPVLVLCSCADADNNLWQGRTDVGEPLPLTVRSVGSVEAVVTRGEINSGAIGVFLTGTGDGAGKYSDRNNCKYTNGGSGWSAADEANTINLIRLKANVWGYYPYHEDAENSLDYTSRTAFPLKSQPYTEQEDVCYGPGKSTAGVTDITSINSVAGISFSDMEHAYALVSFQFALNQYDGAGVISKIKMVNVIESTTLNMTTGVYAATESNAASSVEEAVNITVPASGSISSQDSENMLMIPCKFTDTGSITGIANCGLKVMLTLDNEDLSVGIAKSVLPELEAGKKYEISITLQGSPAVSFGGGSVSIVDWSNTEIDGGVPI